MGSLKGDGGSTGINRLRYNRSELAWSGQGESKLKMRRPKGVCSLLLFSLLPLFSVCLAALCL